ncbi:MULTISPECIES: hypothetical protein [Streptomyces]|uniref:Uncharacterized protein n=1 Tax=Streptomyces finlayi TaxID=67296 RepID=A0A7G7BGQ8_9ACTN|nr:MULTISPECIES: hypothetical protein [Streptomyces]MDJ0464672.1 hypothetical protein [Streptomyces sp. H27-C3]QNE74523.1 hypothetical protein F0344_07775 [Streptomyces finlayi]
MPDDIYDGFEDVVGVLTEQIEAHFEMGMDQLKAAVAVAPTAHPDATDVVKWHGLLVGSQTALDRAENDLLGALQSQPSEVDDPTMGLAHRVNAAVTARDGRAMVVRWLLDPAAPGKQGLAAERLARLSRGTRKGPAVQTSPPQRPAVAPAPAPVLRAGRGAL